MPKKGVCWSLCSKLESKTFRKNLNRDFFHCCLGLSLQIVNCSIRICPGCFFPPKSVSVQLLDACIFLVCEVESPVAFHYGEYRSLIYVFYLALSITAFEKIYFSGQGYILKRFRCFYLEHSC